MQVFWSEITIAGDTGDAARDKVRDDLSLEVDGTGSAEAASVTWKGKKVTGELMLLVLRKVAKDKGKDYKIAFKKDDDIESRGPDILKFDHKKEENVRREEENTLRTKHHPYVIIGCGAAAIVNHTTLRQTEWGMKRVGASKILHVGFEDPWSHYNKHEMGQFPQLLGLPGYKSRPNLEEENTSEPRDSTKFGADTSAEMDRLSEHYKSKKKLLRIYPYCVAVIQPHGVEVDDSLIATLVEEGLDLEDLSEKLAKKHPEKWGRYRLLCVDTEGKIAGWGYAKYVDICTGTGKPRSVTAAMIGKEKYEEVRTRVWQPPESWDENLKKRPVMTGTEGLYTDTDWSGGERYCIMGAGGVGVNMVERARDTKPPKWIDWLATSTLHDSFPIARNDILLRHPHQWNGDKTAITAEGSSMEMGGLGEGRNDQLAPLDPASKRWRFGQSSDLKKVAVAENGRVTITFAPSTRKNTYQKVSDPDRKDETIVPQVRDYWEKDVELADGAFPFSEMAKAEEQKYRDWEDSPAVYDRLIRASGQDIRDVGQAEKIAAHFSFEPIPADSDKRMVGLQTSDGSVRILGAPGTGNAAMVSRTESGPYKEMNDYHDTLPAQGQIMLVGFVFSALNVAMANHYFDSKNKKKADKDDEIPEAGVEVNKNVNTMSLKELETFLVDVPLARKVVRARKETQEGFIDVKALTTALEEQEKGDKEALQFKLIAHGWEKDMWALKLKDVNSADFTTINKKTGYDRLSEWIVRARKERGSDYTDIEELKRDIKKRFFKDLARRTAATEPLKDGWKEKVKKLETTYRPADPFVF